VAVIDGSRRLDAALQFGVLMESQSGLSHYRHGLLSRRRLGGGGSSMANRGCRIVEGFIIVVRRDGEQVGVEFLTGK